MKPAPFKYFAARSAEEAVRLLSEHGEDAKILAGGQSLIPAMNFRMAQPAVLIDINRAGDLAGIELLAGGRVRIGAMTRQTAVERDAVIRERCPLLREAMPFIAHPQIRNRGTIGGSIAHSDPAAELPAVALALRARYAIRNNSGERWVDAEDFPLGLFATALQPDELLTQIELPTLPPRTGCAFKEVSRRRGDYALCGLATVVTLSPGRRFEDVRMAFFSVGDTPALARQAQAALIGQTPDPALILEAARIASQEDIEPGSDIHASSDFRRQLALSLARDTLTAATARAESA